MPVNKKSASVMETLFLRITYLGSSDPAHVGEIHAVRQVWVLGIDPQPVLVCSRIFQSAVCFKVEQAAFLLHQFESTRFDKLLFVARWIMINHHTLDTEITGELFAIDYNSSQYFVFVP